MMKNEKQFDNEAGFWGEHATDRIYDGRETTKKFVKLTQK